MARRVKLSRTNWFNLRSKDLMQEYIKGHPPKGVYWEEWVKARYEEYKNGS